MRAASSLQPTSIEVEGVIIRADGSREDLGLIAFSHRSWLRSLWGQRRVRGGGVLRHLVGLGPKVT